MPTPRAPFQCGSVTARCPGISWWACSKRPPVSVKRMGTGVCPAAKRGLLSQAILSSPWEALGTSRKPFLWQQEAGTAGGHQWALEGARFTRSMEMPMPDMLWEDENRKHRTALWFWAIVPIPGTHLRLQSNVWVGIRTHGRNICCPKQGDKGITTWLARLPERRATSVQGRPPRGSLHVSRRSGERG